VLYFNLFYIFRYHLKAFEMRLYYLQILLSTLIVLSMHAQSDPNFPVQVKIESGIIEGNYDNRTGLQTYLGVPFAQPPIGLLRWKAPQASNSWSGVKMTKQFGPRPVQAVVFGDMYSRSAGMSEDCLYLNVWTPANRDTKGLPVLVYFYGGGFIAGDASEPRYDGAEMAKQGIVVVSANYRLSVFGFLAHPELSKETSYGGSGNYGLLDQHHALKWVADNIEAFGGDPKKVTIAGESAGSISVSAQMTSPLSASLISAAIGESGAGIFPTLYPIPLAEAEKKGLEVATSLGFPSITELRSLSTRDIFELFIEPKKYSFSTVIDGYFYPKSPLEILKANEQAQVPLLLGWNSAEISGQGIMQGQAMEPANYLTKLKALYPKDYMEVLKHYPGNNNQEVLESSTALASDRFISYSTWKWGSIHSLKSNKPVFRYQFNKIPPPVIESPVNAPRPIGAPHACEIEYCMGNLKLIKQINWLEDDHKVSQTMFSYFANFIKTGNPNGVDLPRWDPLLSTKDFGEIMMLNAISKTEELKTENRYRLLDKLYGNN
jgi:para-nitrobenzyl esterase